MSRSWIALLAVTVFGGRTLRLAFAETLAELEKSSRPYYDSYNSNSNVYYYYGQYSASPRDSKNETCGSLELVTVSSRLSESDHVLSNAKFTYEVDGVSYASRTDLQTCRAYELNNISRADAEDHEKFGDIFEGLPRYIDGNISYAVVPSNEFFCSTDLYNSARGGYQPFAKLSHDLLIAMFTKNGGQRGLFISSGTNFVGGPAYDSEVKCTFRDDQDWSGYSPHGDIVKTMSIDFSLQSGSDSTGAESDKCGLGTTSLSMESQVYGTSYGAPYIDHSGLFFADVVMNNMQVCADGERYKISMVSGKYHRSSFAWQRAETPSLFNFSEFEHSTYQATGSSDEVNAWTGSIVPDTLFCNRTLPSTTSEEPLLLTGPLRFVVTVESSGRFAKMLVQNSELECIYRGQVVFDPQTSPKNAFAKVQDIGLGDLSQIPKDDIENGAAGIFKATKESCNGVRYAAFSPGSDWPPTESRWESARLWFGSDNDCVETRFLKGTNATHADNQWADNGYTSTLIEFGTVAVPIRLKRYLYFYLPEETVPVYFTVMQGARPICDYSYPRSGTQIVGIYQKSSEANRSMQIMSYSGQNCVLDEISQEEYLEDRNATSFIVNIHANATYPVREGDGCRPGLSKIEMILGKVTSGVSSYADSNGYKRYETSRYGTHTSYLNVSVVFNDIGSARSCADGSDLLLLQLGRANEDIFLPNGNAILRAMQEDGLVGTRDPLVFFGSYQVGTKFCASDGRTEVTLEEPISIGIAQSETDARLYLIEGERVCSVTGGRMEIRNKSDTKLYLDELPALPTKAPTSTTTTMSADASTSATSSAGQTTAIEPLATTNVSTTTALPREIPTNSVSTTIPASVEGTTTTPGTLSNQETTHSNSVAASSTSAPSTTENTKEVVNSQITDMFSTISTSVPATDVTGSHPEGASTTLPSSQTQQTTATTVSSPGDSSGSSPEEEPTTRPSSQTQQTTATTVSSPGVSASSGDRDTPVEGIDTGDKSCFPAEAIVELSSGSNIELQDLKVGDEVRSGPAGRFSKVILFTHADPVIETKFISISTKHKKIELTAGHYIYVNGILQAASSVKIGDRLTDENDKDAIVIGISSVVRRGLYNPQTVSGDIIVSGIRASTFTRAVPIHVAQAALAPLSALSEVFGLYIPILSKLLSTGAPAVARWIPSGPVQAEL